MNTKAYFRRHCTTNNSDKPCDRSNYYFLLDCVCFTHKQELNSFSNITICYFGIRFQLLFVSLPKASLNCIQTNKRYNEGAVLITGLISVNVTCALQHTQTVGLHLPRVIPSTPVPYCTDSSRTEPAEEQLSPLWLEQSCLTEFWHKSL